jgi:peptidyl-prolyl cis-trans isomerase B (cyclophilin B)
MLLLRRIILGALICFMPVFAGASVPTATGDSIVTVRMQTNKGTIVLELDAGKAPATVANFVEYATAGFYDGTIFHRVIPGFMIQGGGFEPGMSQKATRESIKNEADNGLKNELGTIAMARTPDPHSASSQFFINAKDNGFLNYSSATTQGWGYCVFGKVVEGMDVVKAIESVSTTSRGGHQDVPADDVVIEKVTIED